MGACSGESWYWGIVAAFAIGGAAGRFLVVPLIQGRFASAETLLRHMGSAGAWAVGFAIGTTLGVLFSYGLADTIEALTAPFLGGFTGLALGSGLGWAIGGLAPGVVATGDAAVWRRLQRQG